MKANRFEVEQYVTALYAPPFEGIHKLRIAEFFENLGDRFYSRLGAGIIVLEASKQIYAVNSSFLEAEIPQSINVLDDLSDPKPAS